MSAKHASRFFLPALAALLLVTACTSQKPAPTLNVGGTLVNRSAEGELADSVRVLMKISTSRGISDLARQSGYQRFDATRLPIPQAMDPTARFLRAWGRGQLIDPVMMDINRGMELAAARFEVVLQERIATLVIPDVRSVMTRSDRAATDLLCEPREELREAFAPILKQALIDVGYFTSRDLLIAEYNAIPMLADITPFDVEPELQQRALDAICLRIAEKESRLRRFQNERPQEDTPDNHLLRTLFAWPF